MYHKHVDVKDAVDDDHLGVYGIVKQLSDHYADKFGLSKKKVLSLSYEVLLKKSKDIPEGLPGDWDDGDVLNAVTLEIHKRSKLKNDWSTEMCNKVLNYSDLLHKNKNTEYYQNSISPALKMLLCIEYYQKKVPQKKKKPVSVFFDTSIISSYLDNLKNWLPKEKMDFFSIPKDNRIPYSRSTGNISLFNLGPHTLSFDNIFTIKENNRKIQRNSMIDLDEGFVSPNEAHVEKSPCFDVDPSHKKVAITKSKKNYCKFDWDYSVLKDPPSRHKTWETYDLIGNTYVEPPFIHNEIFLHQWLSTTGSQCLRKIPRDQLLDDIIALLIGTPSSTFTVHEDTFLIRNEIYSDELTQNALKQFCQKFIGAGTAFKLLTKICQSEIDDDVISSGFKIALNEYLYKYHAAVIHPYEWYKGKSYLEFNTRLEPLIEQITYLKKVLKVPLKGIALLKHLFNLMICAQVSSMFYILSSLFLLPCVYFFRLMDDWIFHGKWHKDLPLTSGDMNLVNDRKSWVEAHKPISSQVPWFLPIEDFVRCGKAISLLRFSGNKENIINLLNSTSRPKMKLCLDREELDALKKDCEKYFEEGTRFFCTNVEEKKDLALCALNAAQMKTEAFESKKMEEKMREIRRKKDELCLREEDLIRSAQNKAIKKQEDEAVNRRVAEEQEQILYKEQLQELEKAKIIYERYERIFEEDEKKRRRSEWKIKRLALDEKRKEFLSSNLNTIITPLPPEDVKTNSVSSEVNDDNKREGSYEKSLQLIPLTSKENSEQSVSCEKTCIEYDQDNFVSDGDSNKNISSEISNSEDVNKNIDLPAVERIDESEKTKQVQDTIHSNDVNENINIDILQTTKSMNDEVNHCLKTQPLENSAAMNEDDIKSVNIEKNITDLQRNRMKILGSDLGRGESIRTHIWAEEMETNKRNMLSSRILLGEDYEENKKDHNVSESLTKAIDCDRIEMVKEETSEESDGTLPVCSKANENEVENIILSEPSLGKESEKISFDIQNCEEPGNKEENIEGQSDTSSGVVQVKQKWFKDNIIDTGMLSIFNSARPTLIPDKEFDFPLLEKLVNNSIKVVLSTQVKLVNHALLKMFLVEFDFIKVAQKLREYFFLHGEYGKRLTSALSKAIEVEEPSSLLTFYRLRSLLVEACRGDIKEISFIVKETPIAFKHTKSQALSCLGLTYKFEWPWNLIFTDIAISKYNNVFGYMFSLQRVAWHLEEVWLTLNFKSSVLKGYQYTQIQLYRFVMLQFVCTLRSYIVTTVIESCWQDFVNFVPKVKDLDELYRGHAAYIKDIIFKCFLGEKTERLMVQIQKLLEYILIFCRTLRFGEWNVSENGEYQHSNFEKLRSTFSSFLYLARIVTKNIEKLVKVNYQKELESLYYFLTINSFYVS